MEKRKMLRILDHAAVSEEERRQARRGEREVGAEDKEEMVKEVKDKEVVVVEESGAVEREKRRSEEEIQHKRQGFPQASLESKDIRKDPDTAMEATGAKKLSTLLKNLQ